MPGNHGIDVIILNDELGNRAGTTGFSRATAGGVFRGSGTQSWWACNALWSHALALYHLRGAQVHDEA